MVPIVALPPRKLKELLEEVGLSVVDEDEYHWALAAKPDDTPVLIPRRVFQVPVEVVNHVIDKVGARYFEEVYQDQHGPWPAPEDEPRADNT